MYHVLCDNDVNAHVYYVLMENIVKTPVILRSLPIDNKENLKIVVGKGAFSTVYKSVSFDNQIAVKTIFKTRLKNQRSKTNLQSEIICMRLLSHPCILSMEDAFQTIDSYTLTFELGLCDLYDYCKSSNTIYSPEYIQYIVRRDLCGAVKYIHTLSIYHRDIKPENIIVFECKSSFCVKLADFGLATMNTDFASDMAGSPGFCAPEIICPLKNGTYCTKYVDQWSIGCVFLELLVGSPTFNEFWLCNYDSFNIDNKLLQQKCAESIPSLCIGDSDFVIETVNLLQIDPVLRKMPNINVLKAEQVHTNTTFLKKIYSKICKPRCRVLIVDDMPIIHKVLQKQIYKILGKNTVIDSVLDGQCAIDKFTFGEFYNFIFVDHFLPKKSGREVICSIEEWERKNKIENRAIIVLISGSENIKISSRVNNKLLKPIYVEQLKPILKMIYHENRKIAPC